MSFRPIRKNCSNSVLFCLALFAGRNVACSDPNRRPQRHRHRSLRRQHRQGRRPSHQFDGRVARRHYQQRRLLRIQESRSRRLHPQSRRKEFRALHSGSIFKLRPGQTQQINISLVIQMEEQKVEVNDSPTRLDVDPSNNAGTVVMKDKDLEALSDDPDEMQSELQALAGPSAGPNGGQIYIDGFTAGQLPPKASIREIRINQNPFSSEYDKLGYGRIEILTKPGTDSLHGQVSLTGNTAAFNSRNPFLGSSVAAVLRFHANQRQYRRLARQKSFLLHQHRAPQSQRAGYRQHAFR